MQAMNTSLSFAPNSAASYNSLSRLYKSGWMKEN